MAGAKPLVALCFLLAIATSQAIVPCSLCPPFYVCIALGKSREYCAQKCFCDLYFPYEQQLASRKVLKMGEPLAEQALKEMVMEEPVISLNKKSTANSCMFTACYVSCRLDASRQLDCAKECDCTE